MWWVYIFQLPLCLNIKRHLRLQTLPRAPPTMLWLWAELSHTLSIWGTVKWSPTDLNLGLEHSSKSSEWNIDCTKLKLRYQSKLLAKKYMAALRAMLKPMAYQWSWGSCSQMSRRKMSRSDPIRVYGRGLTRAHWHSDFQSPTGGGGVEHPASISAIIGRREKRKKTFGSSPKLLRNCFSQFFA